MTLRCVEVFGDAAEGFEIHARFRRATLPQIGTRSSSSVEFALQREQDFPFEVAQFDDADVDHLSRAASALSPGSMVLRRTWPTPSAKMPLAGMSLNVVQPVWRMSTRQCSLHRAADGHLERRPQPVFAAGRLLIGRAHRRRAR